MHGKKKLHNDNTTTSTVSRITERGLVRKKFSWHRKLLLATASGTVHVSDQVQWHTGAHKVSDDIQPTLPFEYDGTSHSVENSLISLSRNHNVQNVKDDSRQNDTLSRRRAQISDANKFDDLMMAVFSISRAEYNNLYFCRGSPYPSREIGRHAQLR